MGTGRHKTRATLDLPQPFCVPHSTSTNPCVPHGTYPNPLYVSHSAYPNRYVFLTVATKWTRVPLPCIAHRYEQRHQTVGSLSVCKHACYNEDLLPLPLPSPSGSILFSTLQMTSPLFSLDITITWFRFFLFGSKYDYMWLSSTAVGMDQPQHPLRIFQSATGCP